MREESKITIYLDCDDTILHSSEAVIRILNKRYGVNKRIEDLTDWNYRSIVPELPREEVWEIYDSEEFWNEVELDSEFLRVYEKLKNNFNWIVLSYGQEENLEKKIKYIDEHLHLPVVGLRFIEKGTLSKSAVDMMGAIQIDDNMNCLRDSNAAIRILLTKEGTLPWSKPDANQDNLYVAPRWKEIGETLEFFLRCPSMVENCYGEN